MEWQTYQNQSLVSKDVRVQVPLCAPFASLTQLAEYETFNLGVAGSIPAGRTRNMSNKDTLLLEAQPLLSRGLCFFVGRLKTFFVHSQCCLLYVLFSMFDTFFIMCHFACFDRLFYTIDTFF